MNACPVRRRALALLLAASLVSAPASAQRALPSASAEFVFTALLNDKPIGLHRFSISTVGGERWVTSEADFNVKLLGLSVYRYQHRAVEQWQGACLAGMTASTNDDGTRSQLRAERDADHRLQVVVDGVSTGALSGCVMSFAYWHPAMRQQGRLLNAQTGRAEPVQVQPMGSGSIAVRGQAVAAERWRITGPAQPLDIWYSAEGDWIGLDSTVAGGRRLSYRLR